MIVKGKYKDFEYTFGGMKLIITCAINSELLTRFYDLENVESIHTVDEYVYFELRNGNHIQLKFEYDSCIVLDEFTQGGEHVTEFGCHDFNDDVTILE